MAIPDWLYKRTPIYHITSIQNLSSMLSFGCLYAINFIPNNHVCIANEEIQERRARKTVDLQPFGVLHDYVPFYFAPRSPMLYANHKNTIQNAKPQEEIIYLVATVQCINEAKIPYVFYDQHAATNFATPYNRIHDLDKIDWELFFEHPLMDGYSEYWQDRHDARNPKWINRKAVRQAEFLIHEKLSLQYISHIGVISDKVNQKVMSIISQFGLNKPVETKINWYF